MKTLAHISDLHFGTVRPELAEALAESLHALNPDLIVISGDVTQRAKTSEYQAVRNYLTALPSPMVVVPGNHDIPAYNLWQRIFHPFKKFQRYMASLSPAFFQSSGLTVLGINTVRRFPWVNGRISYDQMDEIRESFCSLPDEEWKILVTHHPFLPPADDPDRSRVGRAGKTLHSARDCQLDLLLAGHYHMSYAAGTHAVYRTINPSALVVQAGTALSSRTRGENNAYNVLTLYDNHELDVAVWMWEGSTFQQRRRDRYARQDGRWLHKFSTSEPEHAHTLY